ncbi:hypothetical protein L195_g029018 [Trifolium pratense]|uniref:Uncharacterized protein n=2 Tax=Trifolium pratense TaxID=57577 RepID=A0ACB0KLZ9_TRIPR|nr:hypothetical protein L195_g029018 [Trifolium pratense]CAJ2658260.1 unnamed protein product [Trifolium pratense]
MSAHKCVDNNPLLGFADSNTLITIVDGKVIGVDKLQQEDMCSPMNKDHEEQEQDNEILLVPETQSERAPTL